MHGTRVLIALAVVGVTLSGCAVAGSRPSKPNPPASPSPWLSGDNGIASMPPDQIAELAARTLNTAASVHLTGWVQDAGEQRFAVDVVTQGSNDGAGTGTVDGDAVTVVRVGGYNYAKADRHFWAIADVGRNHHARVGTGADGNYVRASVTSGDLAALAKFIDIHLALVDQLTAMTAVTRGASQTINGTPTIAITDPDVGTFYIATAPQPGPSRMRRPRSRSTNNRTPAGCRAATAPPSTSIIHIRVWSTPTRTYHCDRPASPRDASPPRSRPITCPPTASTDQPPTRSGRPGRPSR
jgi:hypothetical protein